MIAGRADASSAAGHRGGCAGKADIVDVNADLIDMPIIKGERCVHSMMEQATCQACVQACPRQAIRLTDEALTLDGGRCDGCGLCVPACPEQAISVEGEPLLRQPFWGRAEALAACSRAVVSGPGVLACLNAIGSEPDLVLLSPWHCRVVTSHMATALPVAMEKPDHSISTSRTPTRSCKVMPCPKFG
jgi:ferredoxin